MLKNNHPIEPEELMAFIEGELSPDHAATAAAHLEECRDCHGLEADFQDVSRRLWSWEIDTADPRIIAGVSAALDECGPHRPGASILARWTRVPKWALGAAAACVIVVLLLRPSHWAPNSEVARTSALIAPRVAMQSRVSQTVDQVQPHSPMIVRTTQLTLTATNFDQARGALDDILKRHGGYIGQLNMSAPAGSGRNLEATLRVPAAQLEPAMSEIRKLGRVESESQNGEEVTAQYVDLDARLSNARNTEQRLTAVLRQRTGKLADVLAVEVEIDRVRGEIERMAAEEKTLVKRVDFATLNVSVREDYRSQLQAAPFSTASRIRNAAIEGYRSMVDGLIECAVFLLSWAPSLLFWGAILFLPGRALWRRWRRPI